MCEIQFCLGLDVAQQKEHDRKVAEEAVAAARLEWERQQQQQSPKKLTTKSVAVPIQTIIHSSGMQFFPAIKSKNN